MCIENMTKYLGVYCPICTKFRVHRLDVSHRYKGKILIHFYFIFGKTNNYNKIAVPYPDPPSHLISVITQPLNFTSNPSSISRYNFTIPCNYNIYLIHLHSNS